MKAIAATVLLGAASAVFTPEQQVLQAPGQLESAARKAAGAINPASDALTRTLDELKQTLHGLTSEAENLWEDIFAMMPEAFNATKLMSHPKPAVRRPDSEWDHHVSGAAIQELWTENADGVKERAIHGKLDNYNMRVKSVDPSALGVDSVKQYSGYLDDEEEDKHLFYWFFESRNDPKNDPVVLWLNGGPGCSSLTGLFMELGPSSVDNKIKVKYNPYSWNANASVIFLDQPVNVGYSYSGGQVSNTVAAGKDVYALMTLFFHQFPQYAHQPFHIAGESYAGHYIPVFTAEILSHKNRNINLKSIMIGNGLTDGLTQYPEYRPMACGEGGHKAVLSPNECQAMENALPRCLSLIQRCYDTESVWSCVPASIYCNNAMIGPYQKTGLNVYDIRSPCEDSSNLCYPDLGWISEYLNEDKVKKALGAEVSKYDSCNFDINRNFLFQGDWMKPFHRLVPGILKEIPVLIYAGDKDYICNWLGNHAWTEALEWPGKKAFNKAKLEDFHSFDGSVAGSVKGAEGFYFLRLSDGGHMVPHDQPEASLTMLNKWIAGGFADEY